jgi:1,5-anhydro-D-fructose reductase (1,5-anhydro-D-mannitol-forming)
LQARAQYGFLLKPDRQTWRVDRGVAGGGPLMDVGSHAIDLLCYITGAAVTRVAAFAAQQTTPGDAEDSAVVNLELDTGILAQVNVAFNTGFSRTMLEIHGTEGTLTAEGTLGQVAEGSATLVTAEGAQRLEYTPHDLYQSEIEAFGRAVRGEAPLEIGGEAGLSNLRALLAAYRSSHWGGGVALVDRDTS